MKLSNADRTEALALVASIRRRPAYHLARVWLESRLKGEHHPIGVADQYQNGWLAVGWVQNVMHRHLGGNVWEETLTVVLTDLGFGVRAGKRGPEVNLAERVLLEAMSEAHAGRVARALADLSDPADDAMALQ